MSSSDLSPLSAIQERIQRLREGSELYASRRLDNLQSDSEDLGDNSSRSFS